MRPGRIGQFLVNGSLFVASFVTMLPFIVMLNMALKDPAQIYARFWSFPSPIRWANLLFGAKVTLRYIANSLFVSAGVCLLTLAGGLLAAYAFSVHRFPGRRTLYIAVIALMMVPGILMLVPLFLTTRTLGLLNTYAGMILPQAAGSLALAVFLLRGFFDELPRDFFDTARIDGAREWRILAHIVLPLSMPIISTVAIVNILASWNNYVWPLLVVRDASLRTIPLGLAFVDTEFYLRLKPGKMMAAYAMASLPMVVFFLAAMKTFIQGMTSGALKE